MSAGGAHRTTKYTDWRDKPMTIQEFQAFAEKPKVNENINYKEKLVLRLKHKDYRNVFLQIWLGSRAKLSTHGGTFWDDSEYGVYIRIDHTNHASCPLNKENDYTMMFPETIAISEFYEFGHTPVSELPRILKIVKHLKPAVLPVW